MDLNQVINLLFFRTWWSLGVGKHSSAELMLHAFNLFEGSVWLILAALVIRRYYWHRSSSLEILYALAFVTFGLTDFREAYTLQSWLIWIKLINLVVLFRLRSLVIKRFYPQSKLY